jgi:hypothetical protein
MKTNGIFIGFIYVLTICLIVYLTKLPNYWYSLSLFSIPIVFAIEECSKSNNIVTAKGEFQKVGANPPEKFLTQDSSDEFEDAQSGVGPSGSVIVVNTDLKSNKSDKVKDAPSSSIFSFNQAFSTDNSDKVKDAQSVSKLDCDNILKKYDIKYDIK